jgi:hypothetical protein
MAGVSAARLPSTRRRARGRAALAACALALVAGCAHARSTPAPPVSATATGPGGGPVGQAPPARFAPTTASFVTAKLGFALGLSPCRPAGTTLCAALLRTADGGIRWAALTPPPLLVLTDPSRHPLLRVANALDALAADGQAGSPLALTHDGGHSWRLLQLPGAAADAEVSAVATLDGRYVVVAGDAAGQRVWAGSVTGEDFTEAGLRLPGTATPVSLALAGDVGWLTAGAVYARLDATGTWRAATGPCAAGQGSAVTAADARQVLVICQDPPQGLTATRRAFASSDAGDTFTTLGGTGGDGFLVGAAAASPMVLTVATSAVSDELLRSGDGGRVFALSYSSQAAGTGQGLYDLAFTDATHGSVVLGNTGTYALQLSAGDKDVPTTRLLLTSDGGGHWTQAVFAR